MSIIEIRTLGKEKYIEFTIQGRLIDILVFNVSACLFHLLTDFTSWYKILFILINVVLTLYLEEGEERY